MTTKPTPAQIRARKLFAERARAGTLRKNPASRKVAAKKRDERSPALAALDNRRRELPYFVQAKKDERDKWVDIAACRNIHIAKLLAEAFADERPDHYVRIEA